MPAMRMELLAFLLALPPAAFADKAPAAQAPPQAEAPAEIKIDPGLAAFLKGKGYLAERDGSILRLKTGARLSRFALESTGMRYSGEGLLVRRFDVNGIPLPADEEVPRNRLGRILEALLDMAEAQSASPEEAGRALQALGLPPAHDGVHLLNPDGSATYYGLMLYHGVKKNRQLGVAMSTERLSALMARFTSAYGAAFLAHAPDAAAQALGSAWAGLKQELGKDEKPLSLEPHQEMGEALSSYRTVIGMESDAVKCKHGLGEYRKDLQYSEAALSALTGLRYHSRMVIPGEKPAGAAESAPQKARAPPIPKARLLPSLLRVLDKMSGGTLTSAQFESLVKSFPMGESVWRMGALELWREGLTGKGVKVAVIDQGMTSHPEFNRAVKSRQDFTGFKGNQPEAIHADHVGGTIHALAPDAELRSYKAIDGRLPDNIGAINRAIDKAVADGNQVINMSLGGPMDPNCEMVKKINKYAKEGVLFIISAGNFGGKGILTPSIARGAVTVGALTADSAMAPFSQYGASTDSKGKRHIKDVFMAPGTHIVSTAGNGGYLAMDGTSMAAPHVSGVSALMVQGLQDAAGIADPVAMSRRIKDAMDKTGPRIGRELLPKDAPEDQEFIIVDPVASWRRLSKAYRTFQTS
ncbi:MAG: S8 family peptidase [Elusimicrobia bacterium]|nr:S8 family peptidase [Elusimicrobiota bacterium]